ncbi:MAG TPA: hypothetical protein VGJ05_06355 [Fimbriiglobus sp.]|jgi:hypothetical protein
MASDMSENQATTIHKRFIHEQSSTQDYVRFVQAKSSIHDRNVEEINHILAVNDLDKLPSREPNSPRSTLSLAEIDLLIKAIGPVRKVVTKKIRSLRKATTPIPSGIVNSDLWEHASLIGEWADYMVDYLSDEPSEKEIARAFKHAVREAGRDDNEVKGAVLKDVVREGIDRAVAVKWNHRLENLIYTQEQFEKIELLARISSPVDGIHVTRQGFILLMTAFDAAVFDLVRVGMHAQFFKHIGYFGQNEKITFATLAEAGNFGEAKCRIIDDQLKRRFVKDLLAILQSMKLPLLTLTPKYNMGHLYEAIQRRNLHVHNRGYVDDKYLELNDSGKPQHNIFKLKRDDYAPIDAVYWERVNDVTLDCIDHIVLWAEKCVRDGDEER